jgi:O-antigen/teichoic acid export membrane protein
MPKYLPRVFSDRGVAGRLARGWSGALGVQAVAGLFGFGLHLLLTNAFSSAGSYGVYVYVIAWIRILKLFAKLGYDRAALKFVATYRAKEEWPLLRGFLSRSHQIVGLAGVAVTIVVILASRTVFVGRVDPVVASAFVFGALLLPTMTLLDLQAATLRGFNLVVQALAPREVLRPFLVGALVLLAVLTGRELTPNLGLALTLAASLGVLTTTGILLRRSVPPEVRGIDSEYETGMWTRTAIGLLMVSGFNLLGRQIDTVMLGAMLDPEAAGIYSIPSKVVNLIGMGLQAVNVIMAPIIAQLFAQNRREELQQAVTLASRLIFVFTFVAATFIFIGNRWILSLFGDDFVAGSSILVVLTIGQIVNALAGSVGLMMTMTGHERQAARIVGASVVLNIVLNYLLIPIYGAVGAAAATAVAVAAWNFTMIVFVRKNLGINPMLR